MTSTLERFLQIHLGLRERSKWLIHSFVLIHGQLYTCFSPASNYVVIKSSQKVPKEPLRCHKVVRRPPPARSRISA